MEGKTSEYKIFKKGKLKIGVLGVGIEMKGLVPDNLFGATKYQDPVQRANATAAMLKTQGCDLIICLSHLGYQYKGSGKVSDEILAKESYDIDVIIGGHTHTFLDKPVIFPNRNGKDVVVSQVGFAGIILGRMDFEFSKFSGRKIAKTESISVSQKTGG
jgi:5'-nucleotidase